MMRRPLAPMPKSGPRYNEFITVPKVRVIDPKSAWFKAEIESARARMGADFSACAIRIPSEVK